jgi:hypothetical protein
MNTVGEVLDISQDNILSKLGPVIESCLSSVQGLKEQCSAETMNVLSSQGVETRVIVSLQYVLFFAALPQTELTEMSPLVSTPWLDRLQATSNEARK